ncbi:MAG: LysR family transcriptional regulator [Blautia sp.]|nr:LysR family transcriptional regulator [Blautia sp.]
MTIRHLNIFLAVAETGSMRTAAQQLYISQPTVSQTIRELEEHYGVALFERLSRKLYITEEGRQLLYYAHQLMHQYHTMEEAMQKRKETPYLRVGSSITVGTCLMPSILHDLEEEIPHIELYSLVSNTQEIEQKLLKSQLDAAVVEGNIESPDLICRPVLSDRLVLVCGRSHPFYSRDRIRIKELADQKFAIREEGSGTRKLFEQYMAARGLRVHVYWEANCPRTILNAVLKNNALAVMSSRLMRHEISKGLLKIFRFSSDEWDRSFQLVYHKDKVITPPITALSELLAKYNSRTVSENEKAGMLFD